LSFCISTKAQAVLIFSSLKSKSKKDVSPFSFLQSSKEELIIFDKKSSIASIKYPCEK
jgi:hypothetical protein